MSQQTKYISFSPWWGGWNNQRMSYETAAGNFSYNWKKINIALQRILFIF